MISVSDIETDCFMYAYPTAKECAKHEGISFDELQRELNQVGYYIDNDIVYTSASRKNNPIAVLVREKEGIKRYESINECLLHEKISYYDLTRGITPKGKKIEVLRK